MYIHQLQEWPNFTWDQDPLTSLLPEIRHKQGRLLGKMETLGFDFQSQATLKMITLDVMKSSEIEGETLNQVHVRSSIARRLGIDEGGITHSDHHIEGVVEMMMDATQNNTIPLRFERMFNWHADLFPTGRSGGRKIVIGTWRNNTEDDPMQVVSGPIGNERVHFHAPPSEVLESEMTGCVQWFNNPTINLDPVLKAAIAHLWFVTIHPFDDGNGRIARALSDLLLARADGSKQRFYSLSTQIEREKNQYYDILEKTQRGRLDVTEWLLWFLRCLSRALNASSIILADVMRKATFWEAHSMTNFNDRQLLMLEKLLTDFYGKLTSSKWAKMTKCSQDTANRDINDLIQKGVLVKEPAGGRSTSYQFVSSNS